MPAAADIMTPLWRGVVAMRILTAVCALGALAAHRAAFAGPVLGWAVFAGIAVWTVASCTAYSAQRGRRTRVVTVDLLVTLGLLAASVPALSAARLGPGLAGTSLLTAAWASGPVAAAAVHAGRLVAVLPVLAVLAVDAWVHGRVGTDVVRDALLLAVTALAFGLASATARHAADDLRRAARAAVATEERERMVRSLHDGLLQVLSRIRSRDGAPGVTAELSRLAAEQEVALRSVVSSPGAGAAGEVDLAAALGRLASAQVEVSVPAAAVSLPAAEVAELVAITEETICTAGVHTGPEAKAWVLLEDGGPGIALTIRVDGADGIDGADAPEGPSPQIRERIADLGAVLTVDTPDTPAPADPAPADATEWRITLTRSRRELLR